MKMRNTRLASFCILVSFVAAVAGIKCWQCGQYSDGVGSITPCNNRSAARLNQCPPDAKYCIKYVSELTVVRDCVPTCSEKEWWGARTFCCETDECNDAVTRSPQVAVVVVLSFALVVGRGR